jgi:anti-sigma regulatory factor (Ser/Thr protein kinase)
MGSVMTAPPPPWPLQTRLELAALPTAPGVARGHVRSLAREWGLADLGDTAELVASEIVTNAVEASVCLRTAGPPVIRIWITSDRVSMVIHVWDASPQMPAPRQAAPGEDGGRGLMLVRELSTDWGAYRKAEGGKVVWVMITQGDL